MKLVRLLEYEDTLYKYKEELLDFLKNSLIKIIEKNKLNEEQNKSYLINLIMYSTFNKKFKLAIEKQLNNVLRNIFTNHKVNTKCEILSTNEGIMMTNKGLDYVKADKIKLFLEIKI